LAGALHSDSDFGRRFLDDPAVATLSLLCYREYVRITGLFRDGTISFIVVIGILLITFAELDNWYRLFVALFPLTVALIAIGGLIPDQPKGYIQRVGLGVLGFALFGSALGNLGYMANDWTIGQNSIADHLRRGTQRHLWLHLRSSHVARGRDRSFHLD
jgi:hypothetical protein